MVFARLQCRIGVRAGAQRVGGTRKSVWGLQRAMQLNVSHLSVTGDCLKALIV